MIRSVAEQKAAHILVHTLLGVAVAAAGGNDALSAGLAAGGAEAAAPVLARWLYGTKDPEKLSAEQKNTVSSIIGLSSAAGGVVTGNMADAVVGSMGAQNAVKNDGGFHHPFCTMLCCLFRRTAPLFPLISVLPVTKMTAKSTRQSLS